MTLNDERMAALRAAVIKPRSASAALAEASARPTDVLDDVLDALDCAVTLGDREVPASPWRLMGDAGDDGHLLLVERGDVWLRRDGDDDPRPLTAGDVVMVRGGYELRDGGTTAAFLRGVVRARNAAARPWLAPLPELVHLPASRDGAATAIDGLREMILTEAAHPGLAQATVRARFGEALWLQILRAWIAAQPRGGGGWLGALRDPQIGAALALLHAEPAHAWTVALLAARVRMTRSPFAARFTALVGEPPLTYLTRWRLQLAMRRLAGERRPLREIAASVGYESEAAFSKVFKRHVGTSPGAYRKAARGRHQSTA